MTDECFFLSLCVVFTSDTTCDSFMSGFCFLSFLSYNFACCYTQPFSLSLTLLSLPPPPLLLLAGRLCGDQFGGEQAKGGQTRSLCVHVEEQETGWGGDGVASADRVHWGLEGGRSAKKKKITLPH